MPSSKDPRKMTPSVVDTLSDRIVSSQETMTRLMDLQFRGVHEKIESLHETVATVKEDLRDEHARLRSEVKENRLIADDRHISLVKKVWAGVGVLAAVETLIQLVWFKK